jgi:DNA-binding transcriptional ArsR family regulator
VTDSLSPSPAGADASLTHPVSPDSARLEAATGMFRILSDPTRLHLLWLLSHADADVTALTEACGASRTAVSQHLAKLRFTGMVETRKDGRICRVATSPPGRSKQIPPAPRDGSKTHPGGQHAAIARLPRTPIRSPTPPTTRQPVR